MSRIETSDSLLLGDVKRQPENFELLHRLFELNCKPIPTGESQVCGVRYVDVDDVNEFVSYETLNLISNAVARRLLQHSQLAALRQQPTQGSSIVTLPQQSKFKIVVDVDPSISLVAVLLSILKLGLAYVPVESHSTAINRIKYILQVIPTILIFIFSNYWSASYQIFTHHIIAN